MGSAFLPRALKSPPTATKPRANGETRRSAVATGHSQGIQKLRWMPFRPRGLKPSVRLKAIPYAPDHRTSFLFSL